MREALMQYRPATVTPATWDAIQDFAVNAVLAYGPATPKIGVEMLSTVTHFVLWATQEMHAPLDYDDIFYPGLMTQYIKTRVTKDKSAAPTLRSRLFRIANAVAGVPHERKRMGRPHRDFHTYTRFELAELESWAATRSSKLKRRYAGTFLALAGGAGLWTGEVLAVVGGDITRRPTGYFVRVRGRNPREVPVRKGWCHFLDEAFPHLERDAFAVFPDGSVQGRPSSLKSLYQGPHPAPNPQWLRDTWVADLLPLMPLVMVMEAAGMADTNTLRRYLDETSREDISRWEDVLRNPDQYIAAPVQRSSTAAIGEESR
jgi:hypothetical protein